MNYVFDSTSLIYLGKLKALEKLAKLRGKKFIPENVYKEVVTKGLERGDAEANYIDSLISKKIFSIRSAASDRIPFISIADSEVLEIARRTKSIAIIDEIQASRIAASYGIETHGTVYILIKLMENKLITKNDVINYIDKMISDGFYLSAGKYKEILNFIEKM